MNSGPLLLRRCELASLLEDLCLQIDRALRSPNSRNLKTLKALLLQALAACDAAKEVSAALGCALAEAGDSGLWEFLGSGFGFWCSGLRALRCLSIGGLGFSV